MKKYQVFRRNWWRWEYSVGVFGREKKLVPHPRARKTIIGYTDNEEEARAMCAAYNDNHKPGPLSHKAEYTSSW